MSNIKIFSDSTSDLPTSILEQCHISLVPLYVTFGDEDYRDGVDINTKMLYELVDKHGVLPKTAAPSPGDFATAFEPYVKEGRDIIYIGLSSQLSATIQNANLAAEMLEHEPGTITVVDSLNLSTGIGQQVYRAAKLAEQGHDVPYIVSHLEEMRKHIETEFIIDTLDYLYKGGRCSGLQNIVGTLLRIRPVIKVIDGKMTPANRVRGKREKALAQLLDNALALKDQMDNDTIFVTHSFSDEDASYIQAQLQEKTKAKNVVLSDTGCVISSHCGTNTIGIVFAKSF